MGSNNLAKAVKVHAVPTATVIILSIVVLAAYYLGWYAKSTSSQATITDVLIFLAFSIFVYITYYVSKRGKEWYIRPIEALTMIEEGIGRSAEMGRPVLMTPGMSGLGSSMTLVGLSVMGEVNQRAADLGVEPINITSSPETMMVLEAMVRNAYSTAGKKELYQPGKYVHWTGGEQYAYATYLMGAILIYKPATIIFVGSFLSDIMMSAETGKRVGAIEIGGTLDTTAMATMAMICDSVLIGEEIYAGAAAITKNKDLAGSIAGQDWALFVALAIIVAGVLTNLMGIRFISDLL
jgi:hypothetical protein